MSIPIKQTFGDCLKLMLKELTAFLGRDPTLNVNVSWMFWIESDKVQKYDTVTIGKGWMNSKTIKLCVEQITSHSKNKMIGKATFTYEDEIWSIPVINGNEDLNCKVWEFDWEAFLLAVRGEIMLSGNYDGTYRTLPLTISLAIQCAENSREQMISKGKNPQGEQGKKSFISLMRWVEACLKNKGSLIYGQYIAKEDDPIWLEYLMPLLIHSTPQETLAEQPPGLGEDILASILQQNNKYPSGSSTSERNFPNEQEIFQGGIDQYPMHNLDAEANVQLQPTSGHQNLDNTELINQPLDESDEASRIELQKVLDDLMESILKPDLD